MKKRIAVLAGGFSHEAEISLKSAATVMKNLDQEKYDPVKIIIRDKNWAAEVNDQKIPVNKDDFSVSLDGQKITFDAVFVAIHGTPGEDGKIQGYFDMLEVPYTTSGVLASALTFDKFYCNNLLRAQGILCAESILIRKGQKFDAGEIISRLGLPCFAKPNDGGSSFGVTKIKSKEEVEPAIKKALEHGTACLLESFIEGREITCGVYNLNGNMVALPPTEIVTTNEFFDFDAKYNGMSEEITPAQIDESIKNEIHKIIKDVYLFLNLRGVARIDFIVKNGKPHLIEVNTVPGLSAASIIPQQAACFGLSLKDLFTEMIEDAIAKK